MEKLTKEEYRSLLWLSRQSGPMWGGIYDREKKDADIARWLALGLIMGVRREIRVGKSVFTGGYVITDLGRAAIERTYVRDICVRCGHVVEKKP